MTVREPAVSGQFYPAEASGLRRQVEGFMLEGRKRQRVKGVVSPHAGLIFSGPVAGAVFSSIEIPSTFVLIGPNHHGAGAGISIMTEGSWNTPLGPVEIDTELASAIASASAVISEDAQAHLFEHSLEVQLPFIKYLSENTKIVPISIAQAPYDDLETLGHSIGLALEKQNSDAVILASSDMSHYVSRQRAKELDNLAIERILELNPRGLFDIVRKKGITMCGYMPVTVMLNAALKQKATEARLVKYSTSGDVSGDYDYVVGYAGITIK